MESRGRGRRGHPRGVSQALAIFDQQAFAEAVGVAAATIAQATAAGSQGGPSNLLRFKSHHPPMFIGEGDPLVADHWFRQIENVLEAIDITSDVAKIRLAAFQLERESQEWWDWVKTSKDLEVMTWVEFHGLFMSKYFLATAIHAKAQEFLELRQGTMIVMEYMARFIELAHFGDDYVTTDMAKVRRFENGLKLSIRGKIVGLRLQDMDSMVGTTLAIEREMDDTQGIRDTSAGGKRKEDQPSSSLGLEVKASGKSHCMGKFSSRI